METLFNQGDKTFHPPMGASSHKLQPVQKKDPYTNPFKWKRFIRELDKRSYKPTQFSLTDMLYRYEFRDKDIIKFVQDIGMIANLGGRGITARWKWTSAVSSSMIDGEEMVKLYADWREGKMMPDLAIGANRPVLNETEQKPKKKHCTPDYMKRFNAVVDKLDAIERNAGKNSRRIIDIRNEMLELKQAVYRIENGTRTIKIKRPILFGLFTKTETIKINE